VTVSASGRSRDEFRRETLSLSGNLNCSRNLCKSDVSVGLKIVPFWVVSSQELQQSRDERDRMQSPKSCMNMSLCLRIVYCTLAMAVWRLILAVVLITWLELLYSDNTSTPRDRASFGLYGHT
jgi:hypothetical protein